MRYPAKWYKHRLKTGESRRQFNEAQALADAKRVEEQEGKLFVTDKQKSDTLWRISELLRGYYMTRFRSAKDTLDWIETAMQKIDMGGITVLHQVELQVESDTGEIQKSKNTSDYGRLGFAGVRNYRRTGNPLGITEDATNE